MDRNHEYLQQEQHRSYSQSSLVPFFSLIFLFLTSVYNQVNPAHPPPDL